MNRIDIRRSPAGDDRYVRNTSGYLAIICFFICGYQWFMKCFLS